MAADNYCARISKIVQVGRDESRFRFVSKVSPWPFSLFDLSVSDHVWFFVANYLQENTGRLIWRQNVPFDFDRPFNIQGIKDFVV